MAPVKRKTRGMVEADRHKLEEDIVECVAKNPKILARTCSKEEESATWAEIASRCKLPVDLCKSIWLGIKEAHDAEEALRNTPAHTGSGTKRRGNSCRLWENLSFLREGQPIVQPVSSVSGSSPFAANLKKSSVPARVRKRTASETINEKLLQVAEKISGALDVPHSYESALGISIGQKLDEIQDNALKIKWRGQFAKLLDEMELEVAGIM